MTIRKKDVVIGAYYAIRHDSKMTVIQITRESPYGGWEAVKLSTGRTIRIKSAAKLRARVMKNAAGRWEESHAHS